MKTFKVQGILFGVSNDGKLHVFVPNFDSVYGLNAVDGFWDTVGDIVGGAKSAVVSVWDTLSSGAKAILTPENLQIAGGIATSILGYKVAQSQIKLQAAQQTMGMGTQQGIDPITGLPIGAGQMQQGYAPTGVLPQAPSGFRFGVDTQTMLLIGAGVLVLILALRK